MDQALDMSLPASNTATDPSAHAAPETQAPAPEAPQTADLDAFAEFSFQGKKYTPTQLAKLMGEYQQMSQSQKESQSYKDYAANLKIDLETVAKRPDLAAEFKKMYPPEFHYLVDKFIAQPQRQPAPTDTPTLQLPKEIQDRIDALEGKIGMYEQKSHQAAVAESEAYLQKTVDPLFEKYPYANTEFMKNAVFAKADALMSQGYKMTDAAWDRLVKEAHLANKKHAEGLSQTELKAQLAAGKQAQDTGPGGSAPGQAPMKARTFAEAEAEALRQMGMNR